MSSLIQRVKSKLLNPIAIYRFLDAATKSLTIDTRLGGVKGLYNLASSLRNLPSNKVALFTLPTYPRSDVVPSDAANVLWTQPQDSEIFQSFRDDVPASQSLFTPSGRSGYRHVRSERQHLSHRAGQRPADGYPIPLHPVGPDGQPEHLHRLNTAPTGHRAPGLRPASAGVKHYCAMCKEPSTRHHQEHGHLAGRRSRARRRLPGSRAGAARAACSGYRGGRPNAPRRRARAVPRGRKRAGRSQGPSGERRLGLSSFPGQAGHRAGPDTVERCDGDVGGPVAVGCCWCGRGAGGCAGWWGFGGGPGGRRSGGGGFIACGYCGVVRVAVE